MAQYTELSELMADGLAPVQEELLEQEQAAARHQVFTSFLIPGMLQTRDYACERFGEFERTHGTQVSNVQEAVDARMRRGELLRSGRQLAAFVVCESALRSAMAPPEVMRDQMEALIDALSLPRVSLGVVPMDVRHPAPMCEFWIRDESVVEIETFSALIRVTAPAEVGLYVAAFKRYSQLAVHRDQARSVLWAAWRWWDATARLR